MDRSLPAGSRAAAMRRRDPECPAGGGVNAEHMLAAIDWILAENAPSAL